MHLISILSEWGIYKENIKLHYDTSFVLAIYETMNMFDNPVWGMSKSQQKKYILNILNRNEVTDFLPNANIREDAKKRYDIIKNKDINLFFKEHCREKIKNHIKKNKIVMCVYRFFKTINHN
jgi:hypothetical protein